MSVSGDHPNSFGVNELFQFFGQFVTHDVARAQFGGTGGQAPEVTAPVDRLAGGAFVRDFHVLDANGVRGAVDTQTAFFDLSQVYGQNEFKLDSSCAKTVRPADHRRWRQPLDDDPAPQRGCRTSSPFQQLVAEL